MTNSDIVDRLLLNADNGDFGRKPDPTDYRRVAAGEILALRAEVERLTTEAKAHSCHSECLRPLCVATRENAALRDQLAKAERALREFVREYDSFENGLGEPCPTLTKARAYFAAKEPTP